MTHRKLPVQCNQIFFKCQQIVKSFKIEKSKSITVKETKLPLTTRTSQTPKHPKKSLLWLKICAKFFCGIDYKKKLPKNLKIAKNYYQIWSHCLHLKAEFSSRCLPLFWQLHLKVHLLFMNVTFSAVFFCFSHRNRSFR